MTARQLQVGRVFLVYTLDMAHPPIFQEAKHIMPCDKVGVFS